MSELQSLRRHYATIVRRTRVVMYVSAVTAIASLPVLYASGLLPTYWAVLPVVLATFSANAGRQLLDAEQSLRATDSAIAREASRVTRPHYGKGYI